MVATTFNITILSAVMLKVKQVNVLNFDIFCSSVVH